MSRKLTSNEKARRKEIANAAGSYLKRCRLKRLMDAAGTAPVINHIYPDSHFGFPLRSFDPETSELIARALADRSPE